jgi:hypothetical protein
MYVGSTRLDLCNIEDENGFGMPIDSQLTID